MIISIIHQVRWERFSGQTNRDVPLKIPEITIVWGATICFLPILTSVKRARNIHNTNPVLFCLTRPDIVHTNSCQLTFVQRKNTHFQLVFHGPKCTVMQFYAPAKMSILKSTKTDNAKIPGNLYFFPHTLSHEVICYCFWCAREFKNTHAWICLWQDASGVDYIFRRLK